MNKNYTVSTLKNLVIDQKTELYDVISFTNNRISDFNIEFKDGDLILTYVGTGTGIGCKITIKGWDVSPVGSMSFGRFSYDYIMVDDLAGYFSVTSKGSGTTASYDCQKEFASVNYKGIIVHGTSNAHIDYGNSTLNILESDWSIVLNNYNYTLPSTLHVNGISYNVFDQTSGYIFSTGNDAVLGSEVGDSFIYSNNTVGEKEILTNGGNDAVTIIGTIGANVEGGTGDDTIRILNGSGNKAKGGDGNDILTVYGTGTQKKLKGGIGDDTYKYLSQLNSNTVLTIDQSDAAKGDRDVLVLSKLSKDQVNYVLDSNTLIITDEISGGIVRVSDWRDKTLDKVIFKDGVLTAHDINNQKITTVVKVDDIMSYDSSNEKNRFEIVLDRENNKYINLNVTGADGYDSFFTTGVELKDGEYIVPKYSFSSSGDLYVSIYLYGKDDKYISSCYLNLPDYLKNSHTFSFNGITYTLITEAEKQAYTITDTNNNFVVLKPGCNLTFTGANDNTVINLHKLKFISDPWTLTRNGYDLTITMQSFNSDKSKDYDDLYTSTITIKDYYKNFPDVNLQLDYTSSTSIKMGTEGADTISLDSLPKGSNKDGIMYFGFGGMDQITATTGLNYIFAGAGNDTVTVNYGNGGGGAIIGGDGIDSITVNGVTEDLHISGGNDGDIISVTTNNTGFEMSIYGDAGNDKISFVSKADIKKDNESYTYSKAEVEIVGGSGADEITCSGLENVAIYGGEGNDTFNLDWNNISYISINNSTSKHEGELCAAEGDKDILVIKNASINDMQLVYDNINGILKFYDLNATKGEYDQWRYDKLISIQGWKDVPLASIIFEKNGVSKIYSTAEIAKLYTGYSYVISNNTTFVSGTDKIDSYKFIGSGWNVALDNYSDGDVLDFSSYTSGQYFLQYHYDSLNNKYVVKLVKQTESTEENNIVIGTFTIAREAEDYSNLSILVNNGNEERIVSLDRYSQSSLVALSNPAIVYANDESVSNINTGNGNDTIYLLANNQSVYSYEGNDTIYVNSRNNYVQGGSGNDIYYVDWNLANNSTIYDYSYSGSTPDNNSITILNVNVADLYFKYENEGESRLNIIDRTGRKLTLENWQEAFTNGIVFNDGTLSVNDIKNKIAESKKDYIINSNTLSGVVYNNIDYIVDTFILSENGWNVVVNNWGKDEDILDLKAYNDGGYFYTYRSDTTRDDNYNCTYGKNLYVDVVDSSFNIVGTFKINDFFSKENCSESGYLNVKYYQYGYLQNTSIYVDNYSNTNVRYYNLSNKYDDVLQINQDNVSLNMYNINSQIKVAICGSNNSINTGSGSDIVNFIGNYSSISTGSGDDVITISGDDNYINGESGDNTYNIDWASSNNTRINQYNYYSDSTHNIIINNVSVDDVKFMIDIDNSNCLRIFDSQDRSVYVGYWAQEKGYTLTFAQDNLTLNYYDVMSRKVDSVININGKGMYNVESYTKTLKVDNSFTGNAVVNGYSSNIYVDLRDLYGKNIYLTHTIDGNDVILKLINSSNNLIGSLTIKDYAGDWKYVYYMYRTDDNGSYTTSSINAYTNEYDRYYLQPLGGVMSYSGSLDSSNVYGSYNEDHISITGSDNYIYGNSGADEITIIGDGNYVYAGSGNDNISVSGNNNYVYGDYGSDSFEINWKLGNNLTVNLCYSESGDVDSVTITNMQSGNFTYGYNEYSQALILTDNRNGSIEVQLGSDWDNATNFTGITFANNEFVSKDTLKAYAASSQLAMTSFADGSLASTQSIQDDSEDKKLLVTGNV